MIIGIIGGTNSFSSQLKSRQDAPTLLKASGIVFLVAFIILTGVALVTLSKIGSVIKGDRKLVFAVVTGEPFLLVRVIYILLVDFGTNPSLFSNTQGNVIVQAFMSVFEEFVVVMLYLAAGFFTPKIDRSQVRPGYQADGAEVAGNYGSRLILCYLARSAADNDSIGPTYRPARR